MRAALTPCTRFGSLGAAGVIAEPTFSAPGFFPALPHTFNELATLSSRSDEYLVLSVGQFESATASERTYNEITTIIYYSDNSDTIGHRSVL